MAERQHVADESERHWGSGASSIQEWRDDDSCNSARSGKGYGSSGVMSDNGGVNNSNDDPQVDTPYPGFMSSLRSTESCGSQDSGKYHSASSRNFAAGLSYSVARMVNGESQFTIATSYVSETQRSDIATVCSGSVIEDIEIESVLSQEDIHASLLASSYNSAPTATFQQYSPPTSEKNFCATVFEKSKAPLICKGDLLGNEQRSSQGSASELLADDTSKNTLLAGSMIALTASDGHTMGPPLSRALLQQVEEAAIFKNGEGRLTLPPQYSIVATTAASTILTAGERREFFVEHTFKSPYSQYPLHMLQQNAKKVVDPIHQSSRRNFFKKSGGCGDTSSQASSVRSFGSNFGSDANDTDDCGRSLDMDVYSVENQSVRSLDGNMSSMALAGASDQRVTEDDIRATDHHNLGASNNMVSFGGRQSPGGTIYKGRGTRRYQGRYMHLPLIRFHQNATHLDPVAEVNITPTSQFHNDNTHQTDCYTSITCSDPFIYKRYDQRKPPPTTRNSEAKGETKEAFDYCELEDKKRSQSKRRTSPRRRQQRRSRSRSRSYSPIKESFDSKRDINGDNLISKSSSFISQTESRVRYSSRISKDTKL